MKVWVLLFALMTSAYAGTVPPECAHILSDEAQEKLARDEQQIQSLIVEYSATLREHMNPFASVWLPSQAQDLFNRMSVRVKNRKWTYSPLSLINLALKKVIASKKPYNEKLVQWLIEDATQLLKQSRTERIDLQSELLALKYSLDYLRYFKTPEKVVDLNGDPVDQKPDDSKKGQPDDQSEKADKTEQSDQGDQSDNKSEGSEGQSDGEGKVADPNQELEYPEVPESFSPATINTEQPPAQGPQEQYRFAEVNFKTAYFAQRYFVRLHRGANHLVEQAELPYALPQPPAFRKTSERMIVRLGKKTKITLSVPAGYKPLQPADPRVTITRTKKNSYILETKAQLAEITVPLELETNLNLSPPVLQMYTRPAGFEAKEWPDLVQADILRKYTLEDARKNPLKVAAAVADHFYARNSRDYLYSVGKRPETNPIDALKSGAFQCSMAAYAMVAILRDQYEIPAVIVGGIRAKQFKKDTEHHSYLIQPAQGHVWVQVYHEGRWHIFDPTPFNKDKESPKDENAEKDPYADIDYRDEPNDPKSDDESKDIAGDQKAEDQSPDSKTEDKLDSQAETNSKDQDKKTNSEKEKKKDKSKDKNAMSLDDLADTLKMGSIELEPNLDRNPLEDRAIRVIMQTVLDPTQDGAEIQKSLHSIARLVKRYNSVELKDIYQNALSAHKRLHPELSQWALNTLLAMKQQSVNSTYQEIHRLTLAIETYSKVLDPGGKIQKPAEILSKLKEIKAELEKLAHANSTEIGLVQELINELPPVAHQLLEADHNLKNVGPNPATIEVAKLLKAGKLNDIRLLSILSPISDFVLNSHPRPEYIEVKTWQRDMSRPRGRDILPFQDVKDIPRAVLGQPGKSLEKNIEEGTAYVYGTRKVIQVPMAHGKEEAERITIVLIDTSGSMEGNPGYFQSALVSAFAGRAISDVSDSGRHRHKVLIVPFDDVTAEPIHVTNYPEALDVIRNFRSKLRNTGKGTNIQEALLQALALIADAERRSGEPLAAANIVLMTDGQSNINADELVRARDAIDRQTPLQTMFIAINGSNDDLREFAENSQSIGSEKGFYREFSREQIDEYIKLSQTLNLKDRKDFYTDKQAGDLSPHVIRLMEEVQRLTSKYSSEIYYGSQYLKPEKHLSDLELIEWPGIKSIDRPLEKWIIKIRGTARNPVFKDKRLLHRVIDDLVVNFRKISGTDLTALSNPELEHLRHLIRYAAGMEDGGK